MNVTVKGALAKAPNPLDFALSLLSKATPTTDTGDACWRCQAGPLPPDLETQVAILRAAHLQRTPIFHWPDREWERLRSRLDDGDLLLVVANRANPEYAGVVVRKRGGRVIRIARRELMDS